MGRAGLFPPTISGFIESSGLQEWTDIGTMNAAIGAPVSDPVRFPGLAADAPGTFSKMQPLLS